MDATFFPTPNDFRKWLAANHEQATELWVGYYKKATGKPSITWPESVDQALCYGWIDGLRKTIDEESYRIRFTPRRPTSHWSDVNIKRVKVLTKEGQMQPAGLEAFKKRDAKKSRQASHEQKVVNFNPAYEKELKSNAKAWEYFINKAPSYQKQCRHWIMSAKQQQTQLRRLQTLIDSSASGEVIPPFRWSEKKK